VNIEAAERLLENVEWFYLFIDCESTGLNPGTDCPIVTSMILSTSNLQIIGKLTVRSRPVSVSSWGKEAELIHGITEKEADSFEHPEQSIRRIIEFVGNQRVKFVCHAFPMYGVLDLFDYQLLLYWFYEYNFDAWFKKTFNDGDILSTIPKNHYWLRMLGLTDQKLDTWARRLNIPLDHHNAESDVLACYKIFKFQQEFAEKNTMELL
jgi:DNA polymerase III epsilon subunit-like protein